MLEKLTLGDLADVEDATGVSLNDVDLKSPPMKIAIGLMWVMKRRQEPGFTYEDARNVSVSDMATLQAALAGNPIPAPAPPGQAVSATEEAA